MFIKEFTSLSDGIAQQNAKRIHIKIKNLLKTLDNNSVKYYTKIA